MLVPSIFKRGGQKKELYNVSSEEQDVGELNKKLDELQGLWAAPRAGRDLSAAIWRPEVQAAELVVARGNVFRHAGFTYNKKKYLHIEEAVFLVDNGSLLLFLQPPAAANEEASQQAYDEGASPPPLGEAASPQLLSLQEAFRLMVEARVPLERYVAYSSLSRRGYIVTRHPSRWTLERNQSPAAVWGGGAWAQCYPPPTPNQPAVCADAAAAAAAAAPTAAAGAAAANSTEVQGAVQQSPVEAPEEAGAASRGGAAPSSSGQQGDCQMGARGSLQQPLPLPPRQQQQQEVENRQEQQPGLPPGAAAGCGALQQDNAGAAWGTADVAAGERRRGSEPDAMGTVEQQHGQQHNNHRCDHHQQQQQSAGGAAEADSHRPSDPSGALAPSAPPLPPGPPSPTLPQSLHLAYDVYKPSSNFSRRKPGPRMCTLCVCAPGCLPQLRDTLLLVEQSGGTPLRLAVVECADVLFYDFGTAPIPSLAGPSCQT